MLSLTVSQPIQPLQVQPPIQPLQVQPLQHTGNVKKQSVCVKRKGKSTSDETEVSSQTFPSAWLDNLPWSCWCTIQADMVE